MQYAVEHFVESVEFKLHIISKWLWTLNLQNKVPEKHYIVMI